MSRQNTPRKYPRMARVNEVVREALGDELERLSDPRLGIVTITGVDVSADLRQATVYYSALGRVGKKRRAVITELQPEQREELAAALNSAAPHLRAALGRQVRMKYTPELVFRADPSIAAGKRIDEIIRDLHRDDPEYDPLVADELARQGLEGAGFERAGFDRAGYERADGDGEDSE